LHFFAQKFHFCFGFVIGWAAFSAPMGEEFFTIYAIYLHSIRNIGVIFYMSVNFWYRRILTENLYENGKYPCSQITFSLEFETLKSPMPSVSPRIDWTPKISTHTIRRLIRGAKSSHTCTKIPPVG
jgi:hypothetical protein